MKTKLLLTILSIALIALSSGCKKDDYVEITSVCPVVVSTQPVNGATNVPVGQIVTATFNGKVNPATVTTSSFLLSNGTAPVAGTVTYMGQTASFTPSAPLTLNTTYTATIKTTVKDMMGNALQKDYIWTFSTGATIVPQVISTDPANLATNVFLNKVVTATFSVPMAPATLNATTFTLRHGATVVAGTVTYSGTTASFTPSVLLQADTLYTATITTGAQSVPGTALASDHSWTFTTGSVTAPYVISTVPAAAATSVPLNQIITATFSEAMDPLTLTTTTFTLMRGLVPVAGIVTYSGITAAFTPSADLDPNSTYTATITTGAKNLTAVPLANDYVWTFSTIVVPAPTVISTDPFSGATAVATDKVVTATFSEAMDPTSITTSSFTLRQGVTPVAGSVTYSGSTASFTPSSDLSAGVVYTATITTSAKSVPGVYLLADYVWSFTTQSPPTVISTDPTDGATLVALDKVITADFSEPMNASTLNSGTFTLRKGVTSITGTVSYSGTTASFTPTSNLESGSTYTATITTGAENVGGTPLATNYNWTFSTAAPLGPLSPDLKTVARFGIIAGVGVSNNAGFSVINNLDVGISPGVRSSVTGFPPAIVVGGAIYCSDDVAPPGTAAMLIQAKQDLTDAYLFAEAATMPAPATVSGDIGGTTLAPGIYKSTSTLMIQSGDLTLDGQGDVNAVWIFQVASDFTTVGGAGGNVILSGGAQAKNVYWQVGISATIGDFTSFKGNVLALTSITMNSGATAEGRMLARNGAVVMTSTNIINKP
jgi:hypothetical protein